MQKSIAIFRPCARHSRHQDRLFSTGKLKYRRYELEAASKIRNNSFCVIYNQGLLWESVYARSLRRQPPELIVATAQS